MSSLKSLVCHSRRLLSSSTHRALILEQFGDPTDCVKLQVTKPRLKKLEQNQILVEHLASCINPSDVMMARGLYGVKPTLPAVIGGEGIARVLDVGSDVRHLSPGDHATGISVVGYWQSYSVQDGQDFLKVDKDLDVTTAAQLRVNPCTAYRMMKDFCHLKSGDTMLQNGANSAVGVYAIQIAKHWGVRTINVIRDRPNVTEIVNELQSFGADYVVTEEQLRDPEFMAPILNETGNPKLFLNCVSGKNGASCFKILGPGGYAVTYGYMSKQPLLIPSRSLFVDHELKFFWMAKWFMKREKSNREEIVNMLDEITDMFKANILKPKSSTLISFEDRNIAFSGSNNTKYIFSINK